MSDPSECRPYICPFPPAKDHRAGDYWECPNCRAQYKLTRPKPERWWRNWSAEHGYWMLTR